jgi:RNA polymerase sigma-70 factor (ECF subfamily)
LYARGALALTQPDHGVLRKAQRGDERAFNLIVRAYEQPVYNYVLRLVGDRTLAEDLTQEVFLRVYQGLPGFSERSRFTTWLFQVTKNRVLDELRALERRPRAVVALEDIPPLEVVDQPFERTETIDAVWRAVEGLTVDLKMALLLRDVVSRVTGSRRAPLRPLGRPPLSRPPTEQNAIARSSEGWRLGRPAAGAAVRCTA